MHRKSFRVKILLTIVLTSIFAISTADTVSAYDPKYVTKKDLMQQLVTCYEKDAFVESLSSAGVFKGLSSIYSDTNTKKLPLPNSQGGYFHDYGKDHTTCKDLIKTPEKNVYEQTGNEPPSNSDPNAVADWLTGTAGYAAETGSDGGECVRFQFKVKTSTYANGADIQSDTVEETDSVCAENIQGGKIKGGLRVAQGGGYGAVSASGGVNMSLFRYLESSDTLQYAAPAAQGSLSGLPTYKVIASNIENMKWDTLVSKIKDALSSSHLIQTSWTCIRRPQVNQNNQPNCLLYGTSAYQDAVVEPSGSTSTASFKISNKKDAAKTAVLKMYGNDGLDSNSRPLVTDVEKTHVYIYYFATLLKAQVDCSVSADAADVNGYDGPIKWYQDGETTPTDGCYVTNSSTIDKSKKLNGIEGGLFKYESIGYAELLEYFKDVDTVLDEPADSAGANAGGGDSDDGDDDEEAEETCYTNAGSLGWIFCPLIDSFKEFILEQYQKFLEPALRLDIRLFTDGGTQSVWEIFRDIANIAFVIVFLFVIFSQLTGFGIDNYGIKKILPRLIIVAILVNLSYIICQAAIDLANIVGYGLRGALTGVAQDIPSVIKVDGVDVPSSAWESFFSSGTNFLLVAAVAALTAGTVLASGLMVIIPVLLAIIAIVISFIGAFIILGIRQALAVILVVVSPVAFVLYAMPNTQKLFDTWFKTFKGLLLAYPICSAMIYGGDLVAKILINSGSDSMWMIISAAIISIAPIFFIPQAIFKSMGAIGGAVAKMSGVAGNRLSRSAERAVAHSGAQRNFERWKTRASAGYKYDKDGNLVKSGFGKIQDKVTFTRGGRANLAGKRAEFAKTLAEEEKGKRFLGERGLHSLQAFQASSASKAKMEEIEDEISLMASEYNGNNTTSLIKAHTQFAEKMETGELSEREQVRFNAITSQLARAGGEGRKHLIDAAAGNLKDSNGNELSNVSTAIANYGATGDSNVIASIDSKNKMLSQYMRDVSGGHTQAANFSSWKNEAMPGTGTAGKPKVTRAQNVVKHQLDKNEDLMSQQQGVIAEAVAMRDEHGNYIYSEQQLKDMLANDNLTANNAPGVKVLRAELNKRQQTFTGGGGS